MKIIQNLEAFSKKKKRHERLEFEPSAPDAPLKRIGPN